jgi:hypothetical protein
MERLLLTALKLSFLLLCRHLSNGPAKLLNSGKINPLKHSGHYMYHLLQH